MPRGDRYADRVRDAFIGGFITVYIAILVPVLSNISATTNTGNEFSISLVLFVLKISPDIFTIAGFVGTLIVAGPILGPIGWGLETAGANALFALSDSTDPSAAITSVLIGAGIVVVGSVIWKWKYAVRIVEYLLSDGGRTRRHRGRGR